MPLLDKYFLQIYDNRLAFVSFRELFVMAVSDNVTEFINFLIVDSIPLSLVNLDV